MLRIGIFGGTFNPLHNGHLYIADRAIVLANLDKMVFVPCGNSYHKNSSNVAEARHRYEMVRLAVQDIPKFEISNIEMKFDEPSYTARTLQRLKNVYPKDELCFLMGGDSLMDIEGWYHPDEIFRLAEIIVAKRGGTDSHRVQKTAEILKSNYNAKITFIDLNPVKISSSEIRKKLLNGEDVSTELPGKVLSYIKKTKLYKDNS